MTRHIGMDFGGVIVKPAKSIRGEDTTLRDNIKDTQHPQPLVHESVKQLCDASDGQVWIVSKAGKRMQQLTLDWLDATDFYGQTGLKRDHVRFCRERADKQPICEELGITHFMDDRVHIMQILHGTVEHLYLFTPPEDKQFAPKYVTHVSTWPEAVDAILATIDSET